MVNVRYTDPATNEPVELTPREAAKAILSLIATAGENRASDEDFPSTSEVLDNADDTEVFYEFVQSYLPPAPPTLAPSTSAYGTALNLGVSPDLYESICDYLQPGNRGPGSAPTRYLANTQAAALRIARALFDARTETALDR